MFSGLSLRDRVRRIRHTPIQWNRIFYCSILKLPKLLIFCCIISFLIDNLSMFTSKYLTAGNLLWSQIALGDQFARAFTLDSSQFVELHNAERWKKKIHLSDSANAPHQALTAHSKEIRPEFRLSHHHRGSFHNLMLLIVSICYPSFADFLLYIGG